jgi:plasmid stabilization system protein ParE
MAHRVSPAAEHDLDDIWYYVAKESGSIEIANHLIDTITDRFFLLAGFPYIGRSRDNDFGIKCRSFAIGEYVIICGRSRGCAGSACFPWATGYRGFIRALANNPQRTSGY